MDYGIKSTHSALKNKLISYISAQYLGENRMLLEASKGEIDKIGTLYQEPFIEANPAYEVKENGIENSKLIPEDIKKILNDMIESKLGIFKNPFSHQVEALEKFYKNKDLLVTTGTGSGKTECFMWPMISSIVNEASNNQSSWQQKGVRALMLYPMNALVSDQISRLRRMIGDTEGKFREIFYKNTKNNDIRIPKFGMYTGRTPYPGSDSKERNKSIAKTFKRDLLSRDEKILDKLKSIGKYPAKVDLESFVFSLENENRHITNDYDAELITRQEMQQLCPDILITNYSMLEYMLNRPFEKSIWSETKKWLNISAENKLLFIIDEAHMYKGSSGGEVAFLIRRLLNKLDISRDKVKFILTSASVPKDSDKEITKFACNLTAQNIETNSFEIIYGKQQKIDETSGINIDFTKLMNFDSVQFQSSDKIKLEALKSFFSIIDIKEGSKLNTFRESQIFLYDFLNNLVPMKKLMKLCRGSAKSFENIKSTIFPNDENASEKLEFLLALAPLAKNKDNQVLFPARLHMMFRGLKGIYACSNPNCPDKNEDENITIGKLYFDGKRDTCTCGSKVYELVNDRRCGALFLKGYMYQNSEYPNFIWNQIGDEFDESLKEIHLYIVPKDGQFKKSKETKVGWLNSITGKFYENDTYKDSTNFIRVAFNNKELAGKPGLLTFNICPKCEKSHLNASDFYTKGNEPFYNLVSEQLMIQPPNIFEPERLLKFPNAGRKVLLFSDSRQRAAVLAKDLTRAADDDAVRKVLLVAIKKLQDWAKKNRREPSMNLLYIPFLEVAYNSNLQLFYGTDKKDFIKNLKDIGESIKKNKRRNKQIDYDKLIRNINTIPGLYYEQVLKLICSSYHSLSDIALCWIEPCDEDKLEDIEEELEENHIDISIEEFKNLFSIWSNFIVKDSYALGSTISDDIRKNIKFSGYERFGISSDKLKLTSFIKKVLENDKKFNDEQIEKIYKLFLKFTEQPSGKETRYLNLNLITLVYNEQQEWFLCKKCSGVFSQTLFGKCSHCGSEKVEKLNVKDMSKFEFWRQPVVDILENDLETSIKTINTEEHTAQLSHKDQQDNTWSTTEDYEMRFQDVQINDEDNIEKNMPVDILSCTTTMEVGIDIGSLTAVGLRNIPPMRENYQQRAGRAGRRSSSISTIVTFTDNGPHDNYYFLYPEKIISGEVSQMWIDIENKKLINRHINMVIISEFLEKIDKGIDNITFKAFYDEYFSEFLNFLEKYEISSKKEEILVPKSQKICLKEIKENLIFEINKLLTNPLNTIKTENNQGVSLLDALFEKSILPTYSFPKNIVGFYIEDEKGDKILQKPDRALELAINEYAPGKIVVVDKKTYKSGGIYNYYSKFEKNNFEKPARKFFDSEEYLKTLYSCTNNSCGWFGIEEPKDNKCPFCESIIRKEVLLKPWGFAPLNAKSIPEAEAENEASYAEEPCYSATPDRKDLQETSFSNIQVAKRSNQELIILNKGIKGAGFKVCKDCGASIPFQSDLKNISRPYKHPYKITNKCSHNEIEEVFLGHNFNTDMTVFELEIDKAKINCEKNKNGKLVLKNAAITLTEAIILASARILDVEFSEIKGGTRIRHSKDLMYIDIFLFDSLSSGAGYSSQLANISKQLFEETKKILNNCDCDSSCHECLHHFWNQRNQNKLNSFLALESLNWIEKSTLSDLFTLEKQLDLFKPLQTLLELDSYKLSYQNQQIQVINKNGKIKNVIIYPVLLNKNQVKTSNNAILLSDELVKNALPEAYHILESEF